MKKAASPIKIKNLKTLNAKVPRTLFAQEYELVKSTFVKRNSGASPIVEVDPSEFTFTSLVKLKQVSLEVLESSVPHMCFGTAVYRGKMVPTERSGLFSVRIKKTGKELIVLKKLISEGGRLRMRTLYCTDFSTQREVIKIMGAQRRRQQRPKAGVYRIAISDDGSLIYEKKKLPTPPVIHQATSLVERSIKSYFENMEMYLRNGKSGAKRILLYGPAGSGKTTMAYQIANRLKETHCVVISTDVRSIALHSSACAKHKVPTIIISEECDRWMGAVDKEERADGAVKAFLDGHLADRNVMGELSILITNYPEKIERTILLRPGRIHERIEVGVLDEQHAIEAAEFYFIDKDKKPLCDLKELDVIRKIPLTGAQIENLAALTMDFVNGTDLPVNADVIKSVIEHFKEAVDRVKKYKDSKSLIDFSPSSSIGSVAGFMSDSY